VGDKPPNLQCEGLEGHVNSMLAVKEQRWRVSGSRNGGEWDGRNKYKKEDEASEGGREGRKEGVSERNG
jgi:hypothetical protein